MPFNNKTASKTGDDDHEYPPYTLEEWIDETKRTIHRDIGRTLHRFNRVMPWTRWMVHGVIDIVNQGTMSVGLALCVWIYAVKPLLFGNDAVYTSDRDAWWWQLGPVCVGAMLGSIAARMLTLFPLVIVGRNLDHYSDFLFHDVGEVGGLIEHRWYVVRLALRYDIVIPSRAEMDRITEGIIQIRLEQVRDFFEVELGRAPTLEEASEVMRRLHSCVIQEWSRHYLVRSTAGLG